MNEREIFDAALAIEDPDERFAYLESACGGDAKMREHIGGLLEAHGKLGSFLESPASNLSPTEPQQPITDGPGTDIGPYKLLQELGEGGMGVVYLAEQTKPVKRRVAVKIIKHGMDTRQFIARFEAERQALAMMDHSNIAKVLDAGTTDAGRPYFVMELVKGIPISEFCDQNQLTAQERLKLFISVCQGVQHAHQKGIIHRDLKPSNVLVALYDDCPVPKIIDFGVAKATNQQLTEKTLFTQVGSIVGTWEYMSPEQAVLNQLDVDTRTDVYALGVILYELLTGVTPLERDRLRSAALEETLRIIREEEPPKPSTRISSLDQTATSTATCRGTTSGSLAKALRGDIDCIVMKALEKSRSRRFETASELAADLNRYLDGDPIEARPPSTAYRLHKFAARNRSLLTAASLIIAVLLFGSFAITASLLRAQHALSQLRDELTHKAIMYAVNGDEEKARLATQQAITAGAPESWRSMIDGQISLFSGDISKAIASLEDAVEKEPESCTAMGMLAVAYFYNMRLAEYSAVVDKLDELPPHTPEDYLFKGHSLLYSGDVRAEPLIRESLRRNNSPLGRVIYAELLAHRSVPTNDLAAAHEACKQIHAASVFLDESPLANAGLVYSHYATLKLGATAAQQELRDVLAKTNEMGGYQLGYVVRAWCFEDLGDIESAKKEWARARAGTGSFDAIYAPSLCRYDGPGAAISLLRSNREDDILSQLCLATLLAASTNADERKEGCLIAQRLNSAEWTTSPVYASSLAGVFLLLGRTDDVAGLLRGESEEQNAWLPGEKAAFVSFLDGRLDANGYLASVVGSAREPEAHYLVALKAWGDGNSEEARVHFEECRSFNCVVTGYYRWSLAFLSISQSDSPAMGGSSQNVNR